MKKVEYAALVGELNDVDKDVEKEFDIKAFDSDGNELDGVTLSSNTSIASLKVGKVKDVKLEVTYTGTLSDELKIDTVELSKNKVSIIGDPKIIDKLEYLTIEAIDLSTINSNKEYNLKIICPEGVNIHNNEDYVKATVKVTKKVTKTLDNVSITLIGKDSAYNYEGVNVGSITILGTEEELENITIDNINIEGNVEGLGEGEHVINLKGILVNVNEGVTIKSDPEPITIKISLI